MKIRPVRLAYLKALFVVTAWGLSFVATKEALREISPVTLIWLRFGMGVAILLIFVRMRGQLSLPTWKETGFLALLGFIGIAFHQWLQATGLVTARATTTSWIVATTPIFIAILSWLFLKERLGWLQGFGVFLAAAGVLVVVSRGNLQSIWIGSAWTSGDFLILASSPNWAIFSVLSRAGVKQKPPAWMILYVMGFGWLLVNILFFAGPGLTEFSNLTSRGWLAVVFLGVICSAIAYIFYYDALEILPASRVGAFVYLEPLVTVIASTILLGENFLVATGIGGGLILTGVWLVQHRKN